MNVAIYASAFIADPNCEQQLTELRAYAARRGWEQPAEYVECTPGSRAKDFAPKAGLRIGPARVRMARPVELMHNAV